MPHPQTPTGQVLGPLLVHWHYTWKDQLYASVLDAIRAQAGRKVDYLAI